MEAQNTSSNSHAVHATPLALQSRKSINYDSEKVANAKCRRDYFRIRLRLLLANNQVYPSGHLGREQR
jgi:hypothetical protein